MNITTIILYFKIISRTQILSPESKALRSIKSKLTNYQIEIFTITQSLLIIIIRPLNQVEYILNKDRREAKKIKVNFQKIQMFSISTM